MLGVIAIHVGSIAIINPAPNIWLVTILEILSRFSVPAFFFLSAFGMFCSHPLDQPFFYKDYLRRRLRTVFVPYMAWSVFYMAYVSVLSRSTALFQPAAFVKTLWYGLAMYHIYFLVILLWFYLFMPVWRTLLRLMNRQPLPSFALLFAANMLFNFYSSYVWTAPEGNSLLHDAFTYRLNYVVFHYLFIFMAGAFTAEHFRQVSAWIGRHGLFVNIFQLAASLGMIVSFYGVMSYLGYDILSAIFTIHQLSPIGMVYTASTILFLLYWLECRAVPPLFHRIFSLLGNYSYPIYLVHPVFLSICTGMAAYCHIYLRSIHIIIMYGLVAATAAAYAAAVKILPLPKWLSICLQGK